MTNPDQGQFPQPNNGPQYPQGAGGYGQPPQPGAPQQWGGQQGYPQPGYPPQQQFGAPQPPRRNTGLWIGLGGAGVLVLIVAVAVAGFLIFSDSDEDKIDEVTHAYAAAANGYDLRAMENLTCAAERPKTAKQREQWEKLPASKREELKRDPKTKVEILEVKDIQVSGDKATAKVVTKTTSKRSSGDRTENDTDETKYTKEGDEWKICD